MRDGQTFKIGKKVYIFTKTLKGYDDAYVTNELNRLISIGLVKRLKGGDQYLDFHNELPIYPKDY